MKGDVSLNDLLKTKEYKESNAVLPVILGVNDNGIAEINDLRELFSILIAGKIDSDKYAFINSILKSLTHKFSVEQCKIAIFSSKKTDFGQIENNNYLLLKGNSDNCINNFNSILEIVKERQRILSENKVKNAIEYRKKTSNGDMPFIIVVIDDLSDFINSTQKETENFIKTICEKSNTVDVYIISATNKIDILNETLKANFLTRVAFKLLNIKESESILEESGAELLLSDKAFLYSWALHMPVKIHIVG